jgi:transposase
MGPTLAVEGTTNREVFEAYVEWVLEPTLRPGQGMVMDNLFAHKGHKVRELIEKRRCELLYLPPYSPDLNPIDEAFSKIKSILRKAIARAGRLSGGSDGRGDLGGNCSGCPGFL